MRSMPPSILNGLVREVPRMVPPRGRMPRTVGTSRGIVIALERPLPAVAEADELVAVLAHAAAHDRTDDRVESGAVAPASENADAHGSTLSSRARGPAHRRAQWLDSTDRL